MLKLEKIFVVLDPKRMVQPAMLRAEQIAALSKASLHLYCCIHDEQLDQGGHAQTRKDLMSQTEAWMARVAAPAQQAGTRITTQVEWQSDWREAIIMAAKDADADLIVKTASRHGAMTRRVMKTSDWMLLRNCFCPTLLVNTGLPWRNNKIVAAVKLKPDDKPYLSLNRRIIDTAHRIADATGGELHAATVYKGDDIFFDRQRFADLCRLPRNRVHSTEGSPHRGVAELAESLGADLLVVGSAASAQRNGVVGDTAQLLIDQVATDIVVLPAP